MKNWFKKAITVVSVTAVALSAVSTVAFAAAGTEMIGNETGKKVLKPGVVDEFAFAGGTATGYSDFAIALDRFSVVREKAWGFEEPSYWGITADRFLGFWDHLGTMGRGEESGFKWQVKPGSYFCIPVYCRITEKYMALREKLNFYTSADGQTWTDCTASVAGLAVDDTTNTVTANGRTFYANIQIPANANWIKVVFPTPAEIQAIGLIADGSAADVTTTWIDIGAFCLGYPKASATPITGNTTALDGDDVVAYYEEPSLLSNNAVRLQLDATTATANVLKVAGTPLTLADIKAMVDVTLGEVAFTEAAPGYTPIVDLTTAAADGQVLVGQTKGHTYYPDGTIYASYTIDVTEVDELPNPSVESQNDKIVINEDEKTITVTYYLDEELSYNDLKAALTFKYSAPAFYSAGGYAVTDMDADLEKLATMNLLAKDCAGIENDTLIATYEIKLVSEVKDAVFVSTVDNVIIDADNRTITVEEGMTVGELLDAVKIENATVAIVSNGQEASEDDVITEAMTLYLEVSGVRIPYEFIVSEEKVTGGIGLEEEEKEEEPIPDGGVAVPTLAFALLGAAAAGLVGAKKRRK